MSDVRGMSEEWIADHGRFLRSVSQAVLRDESRSEDALQDAWLAALQAERGRVASGGGKLHYLVSMHVPKGIFR